MAFDILPKTVEVLCQVVVSKPVPADLIETESCCTPKSFPATVPRDKNVGKLVPTTTLITGASNESIKVDVPWLCPLNPLVT